MKDSSAGLCHPVPAACGLLVALCLWLHAAESQACSVLFEPSYRGLPANGATAVPTDVRMLVEPGSLTLDRADDMTFSLTAAGETLPLEVARPYAWHVELSPASPLAPSTEHMLTLEWPSMDAVESTSITFTTGAGPADGAPTTPRPGVERYRIQSEIEPVSCEFPSSGACISVPSDVVLVSRSIDQFGQFGVPAVHLGSFFADLVSRGPMSVEERCIELRARAANGALGEPVQVCQEDADVQTLTSVTEFECTAERLVHDGEQVGAASCSASGRSGPALGAVALGLPWLLWLGRSRRRGRLASGEAAQGSR